MYLLVFIVVNNLNIPIWLSNLKRGYAGEALHGFPIRFLQEKDFAQVVVDSWNAGGLTQPEGRDTDYKYYLYYL